MTIWKGSNIITRSRLRSLLKAASPFHLLAAIKGIDILDEDPPSYARESIDGYLKLLFRTMRREGAEGPLFLVAMPKSGGSWLSALLRESCGFISSRKKGLAHCDKAYRGHRWQAVADTFRDTRVFTRDFIDYYNKKAALVHMHPTPLEENRRLLGGARFRTIYLYRRSLADALLSLYHHLICIRSPLSERLRMTDLETGLDMLLDNYLDYFAYYHNYWFHFSSVSACSVRVSYEDLVADTLGTLMRISEQLHLKIQNCVASHIVTKYTPPDRRGAPERNKTGSKYLRTSTKLRVGRPGGARSLMTKAQLARVRSSCSQYAMGASDLNAI